MRKEFSRSDVEMLLSDDVSSYKILADKLSALPSDKVFSLDDTDAILKKSQLLRQTGDPEQYDLVISGMLARCSFNGFNANINRFEKYARKNLHIILSNKEIAEKLFSTQLYERLEILKQPIAEADIQAILPVLMYSACKYTNMEQLKFIHTNYPQDFDKISKEPDFSEYSLLLSTAVESDFDPKFNWARQLSQFGGIDFDGMLILCAALHEQKPYFKPVVLNCDYDSSEIKDLLSFMFENQAHFNNREPVVFIAKGWHTISGSIQIKNGVVHMTFIDSLGKEKFNSMEWDDSMRPQDLINFAKDLFGKDRVEDNVLIPEERQKSGLGCTLFATKDAMVISKDPSILSEQPDSPKLWALLKSSQTSKVPERLQKEQPNEFSSMPINKKGMTFLGFIYKYFRDNPFTDKKINYYMHDKLGTWRNKVIQFLKENTSEEVATKTSQFSLKGFKTNEHMMSKPNSNRQPG